MRYYTPASMNDYMPAPEFIDVIIVLIPHTFACNFHIFCSFLQLGIWLYSYAVCHTPCMLSAAAFIGIYLA